MPKVDYAQVRTWMEHLEEDCALEEQEEAVRGLIEYVQHGRTTGNGFSSADISRRRFSQLHEA